MPKRIDLTMQFIALKCVIIITVSVLLIQSGISYAQTANLKQASSGIPKGFRLIEGDILIEENYFKNRLTATYETKFWTDGIVPFEFSPSVIQQNLNLMLAAMAEWERVANVDFRPRNGENSYLFIQNSAKNSSEVGMQGRRQVLNILNWNTRFVIVHELGHALGYWHEQSRPDRDQYVKINWASIPDSIEFNFEIREDARYYGPYDFDSVMHYGQFAFSSDGNPTIAVLPPNQDWQNRIGQLTHLSRFDALTMSFIYRQPNWLFVDASHTGSQLGTFFNPVADFLRLYLTPNLPNGVTIWIQPGNYPSGGVYDKEVTIRAPLGNVILD